MRSQDWAEDELIDKEECLGPGGGEGGVVGEQKVQRVRVKESEGQLSGNLVFSASAQTSRALLKQ